LSERKDFVAALFAKDPEMNQLKLSRAVRDKFGKGLSFVNIKKLRDAHKDGSFNRVWNELFKGETDLKLSKQGMQKVASRKKVRGDRRRKTQLKGRRSIDRDKIRISDMRNHLVVYRADDGVMQSQSFKSRKRAEKLVTELLNDGVPANEIGYFRRNEIQTKVVL
jgi:hypothetical protein